MSESAGVPPCPAGGRWRLGAVIGRGRFARMQALEDAIAFRQARAARPCRACRAAGEGERCDDHARDLGLIASYRQAIRLANLDLAPVPRERGTSALRAGPGD
jgi:hypothetical protein